jgi:hypothetical protein
MHLHQISMYTFLMGQYKRLIQHRLKSLSRVLLYRDTNSGLAYILCLSNVLMILFSVELDLYNSVVKV